jgi:hypothetical protein
MTTTEGLHRETRQAEYGPRLEEKYVQKAFCENWIRCREIGKFPDGQHSIFRIFSQPLSFVASALVTDPRLAMGLNQLL